MKAPFQILLNVYVPPMYDTLGWFWYFILCSGFNFIGKKKSDTIFNSKIAFILYFKLYKALIIGFVFNVKNSLKEDI